MTIIDEIGIKFKKRCSSHVSGSFLVIYSLEVFYWNFGDYDKRIGRPRLCLDIHIFVRRNVFSYVCLTVQKKKTRPFLEWDRRDRQRMRNTWKSCSSIMMRECRCRASHDTLSTNNLCLHVNSYFDRTVYQPNGERRSSDIRRREDSLPARSINENSCLHNHTLDHNYRLPFSSARGENRTSEINSVKDDRE